MQIPGVGTLLDKVPFIKKFTASAASQATKYPNV